MCIIKYKDRYIFQIRDNKPNISSAGLLSGFGGAREVEDESLLENAKRELHEETSLNVELLEFKKLGLVSSDKRGGRFCAVFLVEINDDNFEVFEGKGFTELTIEQIRSTNKNKFALSAQEAIAKYLKS